MPRPFWIEAGSCAESVSLVPKLTSFSMLARIRAADMSFRAAVICGSAVAGGVAFCSTSYAEARGGPANVAAIHSIGRAILEKKELLGMFMNLTNAWSLPRRDAGSALASRYLT